MKAVIAAAGLGTRFLPFTKAIPKEMLPIIDKPVIQIIVEDLVAAGVEDIIIVTSEGKEAIEDHFTSSSTLNEKLTQKGKAHMIEDLKHIESLANFTFVHQKGDKYGTSVPVDQVRDLLTPGEPFYYFFADDFYRADVSQAQQLLDIHTATNGGSVLSLIEIDVADSASYGMADIEMVGESVKVHASIEKPDPADAPSNMAISSGFLLSYDILSHMDMDTTSSRGEYEINEAITALSNTDEGLWGCVVKGVRHDTGKKSGYLEAVVDIALEDEIVGPAFAEFLKNRLQGDK